jgi:hypothetical protein
VESECAASLHSPLLSHYGCQPCFPLDYIMANLVAVAKCCGSSPFIAVAGEDFFFSCAIHSKPSPSCLEFLNISTYWCNICYAELGNNFQKHSIPCVSSVKIDKLTLKMM